MTAKMMAPPHSIMIVFGTRPDAIKMAPVIAAIRDHTRARPAQIGLCVCVTGQHREMLDNVLETFGIEPDLDLAVMEPGQDVTDITVRVLERMRAELRRLRPSLILVHGDTTTAFAASLAAFYEKIPVGHVEAGLRSGDLYSPWPEELNRRLIDSIAALHFAPTESARSSLLAEGVDPDSISVTGNTVVDALTRMSSMIDMDARLAQSLRARFSYLDAAKYVVLVTGHRRESFGEGMESICLALRDLAQRRDLQIVYAVHLNPNVQQPVQRLLRGLQNVHLLPPQDYAAFVYLLRKCYVVLTDSGGIQEEAPVFGKPVLVMRDKTERVEALRLGTAKLVGTCREVIVNETSRLLNDEVEYSRMCRVGSPYGDGRAAGRIAHHCKIFLGLAQEHDLEHDR